MLGKRPAGYKQSEWDWRVRARQMFDCRESGLTLKQIGDEFGISPTRTGQILAKFDRYTKAMCRIATYSLPTQTDPHKTL